MKAAVIYATKTGNTLKIAEFIAEGIRFTGTQAVIKNVDDIKEAGELDEFDILILGSATYGGKMMETMEEFLEMAAGAKLEGKAGGSFGSFGWSGEAADDIYKMMKEGFMMKLAGDSLRLKAAEIGGGMKMAQGYGREVANIALGE